MRDPVDMTTWPLDLRWTIERTFPETRKYGYTLYRADNDIDDDTKDLLASCRIRLKPVRRKPFFYKASDGFYYLVSSATEINELESKASKRK